MRFYFYATILVGLSFFLSLGGFETPVGGGLLGIAGFNVTAVDSIDQNQSQATAISNIKSSSLYNRFDLIFLGLTGSAIALGVFGRAPDVNVLTAGVILLLTGAILTDYLSIYIRLLEFNVSWISLVGTLIFSVIAIGIIITALEFWKGND